jgi:HAD superfamily hydrolase (TIGR01509 family)
MDKLPSITSGLRGIIFDMDGVLVDSEPLHERAFYEVMDDLGYGSNHGMQFSHYVGRSDFELWRDFVAKHKPVQLLEDLLARKRRRVIDALLKHQPIFPGLVELLKKLSGRYALGVASGSEREVVQTVLSLPGLSGVFPVVVTAADVEHGKPAPDIFLHAARLLGVAPGECCVIEDSKPGVMAGLAAGMRVIAITNTHSAEDLCQAHHVLEKYEQIERLLLPSDHENQCHSAA